MFLNFSFIENPPCLNNTPFRIQQNMSKVINLLNEIGNFTYIIRFGVYPFLISESVFLIKYFFENIDNYICFKVL